MVKCNLWPLKNLFDCELLLSRKKESHFLTAPKEKLDKLFDEN
jgi:hypothetical protein